LGLYSLGGHDIDEHRASGILGSVGINNFNSKREAILDFADVVLWARLFNGKKSHATFN
jgi:hypothetical protein